MHTKKNHRKNLQESERLLHHCHNGSGGGGTDKVWRWESVGKLKVVGHQVKAKMNELSIHTIAYIQLHVHNRGIPNVHIQGFGHIYDIAFQALPGNPPPSFKGHRKAKNPYLSRYGERWV